MREGPVHWPDSIWAVPARWVCHVLCTTFCIWVCSHGSSFSSSSSSSSSSGGGGDVSVGCWRPLIWTCHTGNPSLHGLSVQAHLLEQITLHIST